MSVYYKFNSELNFSHVGFDGLHISVIDLKRAIFHQKRLGKTADFDLLISNAQTKEEYIEDDCLIPKNTSLIVARVPISSNSHKKWEPVQTSSSNFHGNEQHNTSSAENVDLFKMNGSEEDKIQAMMTQSTLDYDPSNYQRVRGMQQTGEVPPNYRCHRCHKSGHWIKNCPQNPPTKDHHHSVKIRNENKKMTGIPRSLRENPPNNSKEADCTPIPDVKKEIPEDLICSICKNIFKDAVMIPCCGISFCDECIRTALLESDDNECPDCSEKGTSPGSLIPNRFLRNAVASFYSKINSSASREKQIDVTITVQNEESTTPAYENEIKEEEEQSSPNVDFEQQSLKQPKNNNKPDNEHENPNDGGSDGSDEDDNIIVTVPPVSQQSGLGFRYEQSNNYSQNSTHEWESSPDKVDSNNKKVLEESSGSQHFNNSSYDGSQKPSFDTPSNTYQIENVNRGFQQSIVNNPQGSYHHHQQQQQIYNAHSQQPAHGPLSHHPPFSNHAHRFPSGMPMHQHSNYYGPPQQNMRPMRYEHRNMHEGKYHHQHHQMHMGMNDNYGMRYQSAPTSTNLANIVSQNIQQRFGTGIIDDPLEAFNKIMREKEMRRDRFKRSPIRSRSPLRQYSPDHHHHHHHRLKSPVRRRKRSRSFSSSRSYSKSRSRSNDRHFTKENVHRKDSRTKYRSSDRRKSPERSRSLKMKEKPTHEEKSTKKLNVEEASDRNQKSDKQRENSQERHKNTSESIAMPSTIKKPEEIIAHDEPPPPGEESSVSLSNIEVDSKNIEKELLKPSGIHPEGDEEKMSSDDAKHGKKSREKKKHKKEIKNRKKKKRDRKEKKSAQHSRNNTPDIEQNQILKVKEIEDDNNHSSTPPHINETDNDHFSLTENDEEKSVLYEPELSKWERDEIIDDKNNKSAEVNDNISTSTEITTDIIKRAENVMLSKNFHSNESNKVINSESLSSVIKKIDVDKKYESFQVTVPADFHSGTRSVELQRDDLHQKDIKKTDDSTPKQKTSIKDRLGKKIDVKKRSHSRDPKSSKKDYYEKRNYQVSSTISSVHKPSGRNDKRSSRRSQTPEYRRHKRSRTKSPNRNDYRQDKKHREKYSNDKVEASSSKHTSSRLDRDKKSRSVSYSPKKQTHKDNDRKRSRSRSTDSRKNRKKKKKEKKTKKNKSRERNLRTC